MGLQLYYSLVMNCDAAAAERSVTCGFTAVTSVSLAASLLAIFFGVFKRLLFVCLYGQSLLYGSAPPPASRATQVMISDLHAHGVVLSEELATDVMLHLCKLLKDNPSAASLRAIQLDTDPTDKDATTSQHYSKGIELVAMDSKDIPVALP
jgi:hypothetical protein